MTKPEAAKTGMDRAPIRAGWTPLRPQTLVDRAADAIVAAVARGVLLPGDRIVESAIAKSLGISRVPVREALRLLESQGLVVNEPYRGIRLMPVGPERLEHALEVRLMLETKAAQRALLLGHNRPMALQRLRAHIDELELMERRRDPYGFAMADTAFHRELCALSGNEVLCAMWEQLARQLTIIVGLSTLGKEMLEIITEHRRLLEAFASGDEAAMATALEEHILMQNQRIDFGQLVAERRAGLQPHAARSDVEAS
jgi:DNA-binding GntR family transcriptional regulator